MIDDYCLEVNSRTNVSDGFHSRIKMTQHEGVMLFEVTREGDVNLSLSVSDAEGNEYWAGIFQDMSKMLSTNIVLRP